MQSRLWTLNALAVELGRDRRSLARALEGLEPDECRQAGSRTDRKYRLVRVIEHLYARDPGGEELDPAKERARKDKEAADKLALENAETRGDLARVSVMAREVATLLGDHRQNALSVPTKLAPILVGLDADRIRSKLEDAVYELLGDLADYRPGSGGGVDSPRAGRGEASGETAAEADGQRVVRRKTKAEPRIEC